MNIQMITSSKTPAYNSSSTPTIKTLQELVKNLASGNTEGQMLTKLDLTVATVIAEKRAVDQLSNLRKEWAIAKALKATNEPFDEAKTLSPIMQAEFKKIAEKLTAHNLQALYVVYFKIVEAAQVAPHPLIDPKTLGALAKQLEGVQEHVSFGTKVNETALLNARVESAKAEIRARSKAKNPVPARVTFLREFVADRKLKP